MYVALCCSCFIHSLKGNGIGQVIAEKGTFLKDIEAFDHVEFGITSKDARLMSVSTRKLIEHSFLSLLDSGLDYRGRNVGCYMSGVAHDIFSVSGQVRLRLLHYVCLLFMSLYP